jgi:hypothetical protein
VTTRATEALGQLFFAQPHAGAHGHGSGQSHDGPHGQPLFFFTFFSVSFFSMVDMVGLLWWSTSSCSSLLTHRSRRHYSLST